MEHYPTYNLEGLSNLVVGNRLFASIRRSRIKLPMQSTCSIIMVAAGTGLAPFRAFIAEHAKLHAIGKSMGQLILFWGV
jgi:NADPH-ferrihemoprotein reductase